MGSTAAGPVFIPFGRVSIEMSFKEFSFGASIAAAGTAVSIFLGGWDIALKVLVYCLIADYVTGVLGAWKTKTINSEVMFWGGVRKAIVLVVIGLAVMLDQLIGNQAPIFRTMAMYFFIGREGLSILENIGIIGVKLPGFLRTALEQLQQKGDDQDANTKP